MSLDDQFNPNDGTFVGNIDHFFYRTAKKVAELYQAKLHRPKEDLEKGFNYASAIAFVSYAAGFNRPMDYFISLIPTARTVIPSMRPRSMKAQKMSFSAMGLPASIIQYIRTYLTINGIVSLGYGTVQIATGAMQGDGEHLKQGVGHVIHGSAAIFWMMGEYISMASMEPPPKPKRVRVKEPLPALNIVRVD